MFRSMCQGCGMDFGNVSETPDLCGSCEARICESRQKDEEMAREARNDYEAMLIRKYGFDNAMEILGDMNLYDH